MDEIHDEVLGEEIRVIHFLCHYLRDENDLVWNEDMMI
jgi:hypothetical protein